jgi:uncharacterized protein
MAPGPSADPRETTAVTAETWRLLAIAADGVRHAAKSLPAPLLDLKREPAALLHPGASFVTLKRDGQLRGCIGSLEPSRPLAADVVGNAWAAACRDPRFPVLRTHELAGLQITVSTLGPHESIRADTRDALLAVLRPGVDGLVVRSGPLRATFLPSVWEQLPEPAAFIDALWRKARLLPGSWPAKIELSRYVVHSIETRL